MKPLFIACAVFVLTMLPGASMAQVIVQQPAGMMVAPPPGALPAPAPYCRPYTDKFTIDNETRVTRGTACLQPDGAWQLLPTNAPVNYMVRDGHIFLVPMQPFARVIVAERPHHRHDHLR